MKGRRERTGTDGWEEARAMKKEKGRKQKGSRGERRKEGKNGMEGRMTD